LSVRLIETPLPKTNLALVSLADFRIQFAPFDRDSHLCLARRFLGTGAEISKGNDADRLASARDVLLWVEYDVVE
jgi:hypothetical protein